MVPGGGVGWYREGTGGRSGELRSSEVQQFRVADRSEFESCSVGSVLEWKLLSWVG